MSIGRNRKRADHALWEEGNHMKGLNLACLTEVCKGSYIGPEELLTREVSSITTDSRKVEQGGLFVAIPGERVDGHNFVAGTRDKGVLCALVEHPVDADVPQIVVESSLAAVKAIAEKYLEILQLPVVGITGSVGKTSTKETIAAVLEQKYNVLKTAGNFNNELGLPLTVFRLREEHEIAVLEMGISDFGEMHRLAAIAKPNTAVITNIGWCHLENLKTRDGILKAKTEVFDHLKDNAVVILNGDDDKLATVKEVQGKAPITFGIDEKNTCYATGIRQMGFSGTHCTMHTPIGSFEVQIPVPGNHMVYNALAAAAVGIAYGLDQEQIVAGIESMKTIAGRFLIMKTDRFTVVDDCYNANPVSMKASVDVLATGGGRRVAVLGDMGELGEEEAALHAQVGTHVGESGIEVLYTAGPLCKANLAVAAKAANPALEVCAFDSREELLAAIGGLVKEGDSILVKASHFMKFTQVIDALTK